MIKIFPDCRDEQHLKDCIHAYNTYTGIVGMNTCCNKAHFFAQARIEVGLSLSLKKAENLNYSTRHLLVGIYSKGQSNWKKGNLQTKESGYYQNGTKFSNPPFSYLLKTENKHYAEELGRKDLNANNDKLIQSCQHEKLTNLIYADENRSAKHKLGNNQPGDGWRFRGRGMIQLTGRDNYTNVYNVIKEISPTNILTDQGALAIEQQTSMAVLTSMGYWKYKKVEKAANRQKNVDIISKAIGSDVDWSGKAKSFKDVISILFKVDQCQWGGGSMSEDINNNQYRIDIDLFKVEKISTNESSKKYQYLIYKNNIAIKTYTLDKNNYGWLPFPETGNNWGRFGSRDTGGDNFIEEYVCAILFGFFYSLPDNGFSDTLYYNDINANDGRNIGHAGHRNGNDIDIRYPGSTNKAGGIKWSQAMKAYNSEKDFIDVLENILEIAKKWGFNKNYAYKIGIKYTTGAAIAVHQDHFHLGYRK